MNRVCDVCFTGAAGLAWWTDPNRPKPTEPDQNRPNPTAFQRVINFEGGLLVFMIVVSGIIELGQWWEAEEAVQGVHDMGPIEMDAAFDSAEGKPALFHPTLDGAEG